MMARTKRPRLLPTIRNRRLRPSCRAMVLYRQTLLKSSLTLLNVHRVRKFVMASRANYATELDVGQLIKDPYFTLFESVGALEVSRSPRQDLVNSR
jgi:hypothetical protein